MFRWKEETLAVAHLWAIEFPYEGVNANFGLFASKESAEAFIASEKDMLDAHAVPIALPTVG